MKMRFTLVELSADRKCFTLVELLVVIAIIGMLVAILLPSLKKAKDMSKRIVCVSNLRQCMLGVASYASDQNGFTPPQVYSGLNRSEFHYTNPYGRTGMDFFEEYLNIKFKAPTYAAGTFKIFEQGANILVCPTKTGAAKNPSYTDPSNPDHVALFDSATAYIFPGFSFPHWWPVPVDEDFWPRGGLIRLDKLVRTASYNGKSYQKALICDKVYRSSERGSADNHQNGGNYLYGDGHVTWVPYAECTRVTTGSYSNQSGATLPYDHLWPDRAYATQLQGIRTNRSEGTAWHGDMTQFFQ